ncbi:hypothetical protein BC831DRAFT_450136 [Entophlyctis helioformis]|nr:hypothetical protein BC831DRAFT_450136 [Entophlyctis helioformis]
MKKHVVFSLLALDAVDLSCLRSMDNLFMRISPSSCLTIVHASLHCTRWHADESAGMMECDDIVPSMQDLLIIGIVGLSQQPSIQGAEANERWHCLLCAVGDQACCLLYSALCKSSW